VTAILLVIVVLVLVLAGLPAAALVMQALRAGRQRVTLHEGVLSIDDAVWGAARRMPVERIGAVIQVEGDRSWTIWRGNRGIWTWGGIIVLDTAGRLAAHVIAIPGTDLPIPVIASRIPAPVHREVGSRVELLIDFPRAVGFSGLRGSMWWALALVTLVIAVAIAALVLTLVGFLVGGVGR
jgi:hypothetical protein